MVVLIGWAAGESGAAAIVRVALGVDTERQVERAEADQAGTDEDCRQDAQNDRQHTLYHAAQDEARHNHRHSYAHHPVDCSHICLHCHAPLAVVDLTKLSIADW